LDTLGSANASTITGLAVGDDGSLYGTGYTSAGTIPLVNAVQDTCGGGVDAFLTHWSADGSTVLSSTFLGGQGYDAAYAIQVGPAGRVTLTGTSSSSDFPGINAVQSALGGGQDAFVASFLEDGSAVVLASLLGGTSNEEGRSLTFDSQGRLVLVGS